jgi:hypothetical protein
MNEVVGQSLDSKESVPAGANTSAITSTARWLRERWIAFLVVCALVLVPCFWHPHIQAGDLGSHLYNAWLSQTVAQGYLPGLHFQRQHTNVLFDLLLSKLFPFAGARGTERIAVSICVLLFFWGAFALASAAAQRPAWCITPLLAMISYGAIFHWGFFSFYLSVAFSLFGLALIFSGNAKDWWLLPILLALAVLAHPMGAACLVGLGVYLAGLRWLSPRYGILLSLLLLVVAFGVRAFLVHHFEVLPRETPYYGLLGADQLVVFGRNYFYIALAALGVCLLCFAQTLRDREILASPWLQFYAVIAVIVCFSPGGLYSQATFGMMGYLPDRGSLYSAVALATLVAYCRPRAWFIAATSILAAFFFFALHHDTGLLEQRQAKATQLVRPHSGRRVISMLEAIPGWRIHEDHSVDRACIGQCYSYNNYEPSTRQFRLRADRDNRVVLIDDDSLDSIKDGDYTVQRRDLPLYEVYNCGQGPTDLCITELHDGQKNGDVPNRFGE